MCINKILEDLKNIKREIPACCTQRNIFEIFLNQAKIRLYLPCTAWFGTTNGCPFGFISIGKIVNTIWFRFYLIRIRKDFSVCKWYSRAKKLSKATSNLSLTQKPKYSCSLTLPWISSAAKCILKNSHWKTILHVLPLIFVEIFLHHLKKIEKK